ncbi:MAG TPA: DUF4097 family beta strand repeat-containing protein [Solirubrobacteraceae bacterium]|nr:DUF4097 family beta strand repeat-containing protein [Solirubrobacteraceae bacterium]
MAIADPPRVNSWAPSRGWRRALAALGGLALVWLIGWCAFELIDLVSRHTFDVTTTYAGVRSLEVEGGTGDVHIAGGTAGSGVVVVEQVTEGLTTPHRNAVRGAGGALRLSASCPIGVTNYCRVSYTVTVPPGVSVTADSGAGDVDAHGLTTTAPLKLSSGDGDVDAVGVTAGNVTLESGNGDVTATLDQAPTHLDASSGNGNLNLTVPNATYAVHASSGNGSVSDPTLRIDPSSPRSITASSGNGNVTIHAAGVTTR